MNDLPEIKVNLPMPPVTSPKLERFSFCAEPNMSDRVHRLAEHYGQSHLTFSQKVAFLLEKLETLTDERRAMK